MKRHQPALLGGLFIGVLASLPVVNLCCCLWMLAGGALTVYLQQQQRPEPVETGDAVIGGLLAGLVGALIASVIGMAMYGIGGAALQDQIRAAIEQNAQIPPETRDMIMSFVAGRNLMLIGLLINLPLYAVFSMLGALIGLAMFRKKTPPQAV